MAVSETAAGLMPPAVSATTWPALEADPVRLARLRVLERTHGRLDATCGHDGQSVRIDRADPLILVSGNLVRWWEDSSDGPPYLSYEDGKLTITGINRRVIYVLGAYLPEVRCWEASWPD